MATLLRLDQGGADLDGLAERAVAKWPELGATEAIRVGTAQLALDVAAQRPVALVMSGPLLPPGYPLMDAGLRNLARPLSGLSEGWSGLRLLHWQALAYTVGAILAQHSQARAVMKFQLDSYTPARWASTLLDSGLQGVSDRVSVATWGQGEIVPIAQIAERRSTQK